MKKLLPVAFVALFLLHNDLWYWSDPRFVLGLPIGIVYHLAFCFAASLLMAGFVFYAWPADLDAKEESEDR